MKNSPSGGQSRLTPGMSDKIITADLFLRRIHYLITHPDEVERIVEYCQSKIEQIKRCESENDHER